MFPELSGTFLKGCIYGLSGSGHLYRLICLKIGILGKVADAELKTIVRPLILGYGDRERERPEETFK
jgi:hypothetical protein